jgi:hypothetical protein
MGFCFKLLEVLGTKKMIALPAKDCVHTLCFALQMKVGIWLASKTFESQDLLLALKSGKSRFASNYLKSGH